MEPAFCDTPGATFGDTRSGTVGLGETSCCPSAGGQRKWCCRQHGAALFAELDSPGGVECCDVAAGGAYPEGEGLPPRFEGRVLDGDRERGFLNRAESSFSEEFGEMTFARSGEVRLSFAVAIELACGVPEESEWSFAAVMIPDAGSHDSFLARHPGHLAQTRDGVIHEVNDELREGGVEAPVLERELFGGCSSHVDRGIARVRRGDKGVGRIDGTDLGWSQALDEFGSQRARAASDVKDMKSVDDRREVCERGRERRGIPAHESVVSIGADRETHGTDTTPRRRRVRRDVLECPVASVATRPRPGDRGHPRAE